MKKKNISKFFGKIVQYRDEKTGVKKFALYRPTGFIFGIKPIYNKNLRECSRYEKYDDCKSSILRKYKSQNLFFKKNKIYKIIK